MDIIIGDPACLPHPVVYMGKGIGAAEKKLRKKFCGSSGKEIAGGIILAVLIPFLSFLVSGVVLYIAYKINFILFFVLHTFWSFQLLASKCLASESRKVYRELKKKDINSARKQLSYLVGRDTSVLDEDEIIKATVETVAENTSDGITAPLFYLMIGGVPLGMLYKAVNTLDSMVGYRNEKYEYFGKMSAYMDDVLNFIPSRLCGLFMCISSGICGFDMKNSFRIFMRDRKNHLSPNSAQTESAAAGALGIRLGGTHVYFGKTVEKPYIGDSLREAEPDDILKTDRLMFAVSFLSLIFFEIVNLLIKFLF